MLISEGRPSINEVLLLFSDEFITRFMQDADVFEASKVLLKPPVWGRAVDDFGVKNIDAIGRALTAANERYDLVAACTHNYCWLNPRVKSVSNGSQWWLFTEEYVKSVFHRLRDQQDAQHRTRHEQSLGR